MLGLDVLLFADVGGEVVKLHGGKRLRGLAAGAGALQPPESAQSSSFQFPCRIENEPLME